MQDAIPPFPVSWENPEDAQAMWLSNETYNIRRMRPLDFDLRLKPMIAARNELNEHWHLPFRLEPRLINGFPFQKFSIADLPLEALSESLRETDERLRKSAQSLIGDWESVWLPEIQQHLAYLDSFNLDSALPELLRHLAEVKRRLDRLWVIHFYAQDPAVLAMSDFEDAFRSLFPDAPPVDAYDLLAGSANKTVETNLRLWELGGMASQDSALRELITTGEPAQLRSTLSQSAQGQLLWQAIEGFLRTYGERNDDLYIDSPTWIDDPGPVLQGLRETVMRPEHDLPKERVQQAAQREARLTAVRAQLASHPQPVIEEFESLLAVAKVGSLISEDHHFWLDCKITYHARTVSLAVGRRLVEQGLLDRAEDVFDLTLAELLALAEPAADSGSLRATIQARQAEAARFAGVSPPPFLGTPRPLPPLSSAFMSAGAKYSGGFMAPPTAANELRGSAGSRGTVSGPARIIRSLAEADRLKPGDILVAPTTLPAWTPLFAKAAALVTNVGGALSHAAVVAREYGIPAVVGARGATEAIRDGQIIHVDGNLGVVRLEGGPA